MGSNSSGELADIEMRLDALVLGQHLLQLAPRGGRPAGISSTSVCASRLPSLPASANVTASVMI